MIHSSVLAALPAFNKPLEGFVLWPYQDILGLVTIGVGCLIEPVGLAIPLPWLDSPSPADIRNEWAKVNACRPALHFNQYRDKCELRLDERGVDSLLEQRAEDFAATLQAGFPGWDDWPADAQLAVYGIAWACGPAFWRKFVNFRTAANRRDWLTAMRCAEIRSAGNAGVIPRNKAVALCLANAAEIDSPDGYGTPALYWPGHVGPAVPVDADPRAVPLSVIAARAADDSLRAFDIQAHGLTAHSLELAA